MNCYKCGSAVLKWNPKKPYCRSCINKYNREHYNSSKDRNRHLKYWYGIDQNEYDQMFKKQQGKCAICNKEGKLCVDHCHIEGHVRQLLCYSCNLLLGKIELEPDRIFKMLDYINYHGKKK